jgi:hypothetical protein
MYLCTQIYKQFFPFNGALPFNQVEELRSDQSSQERLRDNPSDNCDVQKKKFRFDVCQKTEFSQQKIDFSAKDRFFSKRPIFQQKKIDISATEKSVIFTRFKKIAWAGLGSESGIF